MTDEVVYMTADLEDETYIVARQPSLLDENGHFINDRVTCRHREDIIEVDRELIDYMDVSPKMMVSVATSFIPFLENDDANRALMGANMQRQAVPLMVTESPIVGNRYRAQVGCRLRASAWWPEDDGVVTKVSATDVTVRYDNGAREDLYPHQVCAQQPGHLCQPASQSSTQVTASPRARSLQTVLPTSNGEICSGQKRTHRLHELGGLQLRGCNPAQRAPGS